MVQQQTQKQQQRSVHFSMPLRYHSNNADEPPPPIFSPTQVLPKQSVLHSVFSPNHKCESQRQIEPVQTEWVPEFSSDSLPLESSLVSPSNSSPSASASGRNQPTPSPSYRAANFGTIPVRNGMASVTPPSPRRTSHSTSFRPTNEAHLMVNVSPTSTISNDNDVFYSPRSSMEQLESPASASTNKSASFKSLRDVTLLDVEKIKTCNSVDDLQNVIEVLDGEGKFQALLRKAKGRLQEIMGSGIEKKETATTFRQEKMAKNSPSSTGSSNRVTNTNPPARPPTHLSILPPAIPNYDLSPSSRMVETQSDANDSLVMSLSSSIPDYYFENGSIRNPHSPASGYDINVTKELKRLTETVLSMESARLSDRKVFLEKLNSLERTTDAGGNDVKTIETIVERSSQTTKELLSSLEKLRSESYELHSNVKKEREAWNETYLRARQLETRLCQKAEELTAKLTEGSSNNNQEITNEMKELYEEKIIAKTRQNEKLSQVLREMQKNLEEGNKERDHLLQEILLASGRNKNELRTMDQAERNKLVSGFTQKYLSLKAGTDSLAKAVADLEKERSQISEEKRRVLEQLEKTKKSEYQLERANLRLTEKIQGLSQELAVTREQVANNLRRVGAENWEAQEEKYKEIIRTLKQQLRSSDTMVSVGLYRSAVNISKEKEAELKSLKEKYSDLESQLKEKSKTAQKEEEESQKQKDTTDKIAKLESQLHAAKEKANTESEKRRAALRELEAVRADVNLESAMDGNANPTLKTPPPKNNAPVPVREPVKDGSQKTVQAQKIMTKTPLKSTESNKENQQKTPKTVMKLRRDGAFPMTARELRQRVQKMRSPRNALQSLSVNIR